MKCIRKKYGEPAIVKIAKASRVIWLRHVFSHDDAFPSKKITFSRTESKLGRGRPPSNGGLELRNICVLEIEGFPDEENLERFFVFPIGLSP